MKDPTIATFAPNTFSPEQIQRHWLSLSGGLADPFDVALLQEGQLDWRVKDQYVALMDKERMVARAGFLIAGVSVGNLRFDAVGIGGVIVAPDRRGLGLARTIMIETTRQAAELGPEFGLLFCFEDRAGLYSKLGWHRIRSEVRVDQAVGPHVMSQLTMWARLRGDGQFPTGPVRVHSEPF